MKSTKFLAGLFVVGGLAVSQFGYATEDMSVASSYFPLDAAFGCNGHQYTVRFGNHTGEVQSCDLSCHTKFHNEKHHVTVYPYESAMVYGTFGRTTTTCDVWCAGQYTGATQTFTVAGSCGLL